MNLKKGCNMEKIYINKHYEKDFLIEHCKEIKTVIIPRDTTSYSIDGSLLEICTDIENFIIEDRSFMFKDGVLYCRNSLNNTRDILYVTKAVDKLVIDSRIAEIVQITPERYCMLLRPLMNYTLIVVLNMCGI